MDSQISLFSKASVVRLLILDVDGVLTAGEIVFDDLGREIKVFNVRDGHGIKMLQRFGIEVAIITGRQSEVVQKRAQELGIRRIFQGFMDKSVAYVQLKSDLALSDSEIACIGDDINDIPLFRRAGLPIAVNDAAEELKTLSLLVTANNGGRGAVREVCELILKSKGRWQTLLDEYLQL